MKGKEKVNGKLQSAKYHKIKINTVELMQFAMLLSMCSAIIKR